MDIFGRSLFCSPHSLFLGSLLARISYPLFRASFIPAFSVKSILSILAKKYSRTSCLDHSLGSSFLLPLFLHVCLNPFWFIRFYAVLHSHFLSLRIQKWQSSLKKKEKKKKRQGEVGRAHIPSLALRKMTSIVWIDRLALPCLSFQLSI